MISVAAAKQRILDAFLPLGAEQVPLDAALGRVLASPVMARVTQPPNAVSAMDGYAIRAADATSLPARLRLTESIAAGDRPRHCVGVGEAARIFTGSQIPDGADTVVIQENCIAEDGHVVINTGAVRQGQFVRPAGLDFREGEQGLAIGRRLSARDIGLAAAMNWPWVRVTRKPRIGILSTGNELANPGERLPPAGIYSSNSFALSAFVRACGAEPCNLGNAPDQKKAIVTAIAAMQQSDLLITTGGASQGEHDLVRAALEEIGMKLDFWKIAMRPGKPLMFGRIGKDCVIGLPGNPVSALVTAIVFIRPAIQRMLGALPDPADEPFDVRLGAAVAANDEREDYLRATLRKEPDSTLTATPFNRQDSAMLANLALADVLIIRPPHAPAASAGNLAQAIRIGGGCLST